MLRGKLSENALDNVLKWDYVVLNAMKRNKIDFFHTEPTCLFVYILPYMSKINIVFPFGKIIFTERGERAGAFMYCVLTIKSLIMQNHSV